MIKATIQTLSGELEIEIKKNNSQFILLVVLSKSAHYKENGRAWNGSTTDEGKIQGIADLIRHCYSIPSSPKQITLNDGRYRKIKLNDGEAEIQLILKDKFDHGSPEFQLEQKLFEFLAELIPDETLKTYLMEFW